MHSKRLLTRCLLLFIFSLSACLPIQPQAVRPTPTRPSTGSIDLPDVQAVARSFLQAWKDEDYASMYAALTTVGQDAMTQEQFETTYRGIAVDLSLQSLEAELLSALVQSQSAQVGYRVTYHTALLGDLQRDMVMNLTLENGAWRIQWEKGLILPELKGGNRLSVEYEVPARGDIYDRRGKALTAQADAVALGVEPAKLREDQTEELLAVLSELLRLPPEEIRAAYSGSSAEYVPLGEALSQEVNNQYQRLEAISGLVMTPYRGRYYFDGGVAPHVTGYVLSISPEELEEYQLRGYSGDEKVGAAGLEKWGEDDLTGQRGTSVYVVSPENKIVTLMAETDPQAARYVCTTLEKDLQFQSQRALQGFTGAIVVLERDSGRILAMVSSPGYDPNLFEPTNRNSFTLGAVLNDPSQPLLNRATQGVYPLGSVTKIITMAAALESENFTPDSTYNCGYEFTELGDGTVLYDWTYTNGLMPSGLLNLPEGLMLSCNPWFWHIGLNLFQTGKYNVMEDLAHGFGLGSKTGLEQLPEASGSFPEAQDAGQAVQMAIGQGPMLVTPLQVASFVAAVGNGGTLYQPQIIEKVATPDGVAESSFKPIVIRRLPVSAENLLTIQDAMRAVVEDRRGTARNAFTGLQIPVYGKTGTAQNAGDMPHAWFAGYTDAARSDRPDIAIAVLAENAGEGSMVAAPIFRRVVEIYFSGKPVKLYPWESSFYVVPDIIPGMSPNLPGVEQPAVTPTP